MSKFIDKSNPVLGGQAVINGVMIKGKNKVAIATYNNKKLKVKKQKFKSITEKKFFGLFFIRGIINLFEMLKLGLSALDYSAKEAGGKEETKLMFTVSLVIAAIIGVALFVAFPVWLTKLFVSPEQNILFNLLDGIIRIIIFITYILLISLMRDVKELFEFHGAEHMSVHCHDKGLPLTLKNVKKFKTQHPRCGTSFLLILLVISIIVFTFITTPNLFYKILLRILVLPIIIGLSYEALRWTASKSDKNIVFRFLTYPGILLQHITTRQPNDIQLKAAIAAVEAAK